MSHPVSDLADGSLEHAAGLTAAVIEQIQSVYVGPREVAELMMVSLLARGHVLLEGVPGVAKTTLVKAFAATLGCSFSTDPVHPRPSARRHHRDLRALSARWYVFASRGSHLCQRGAG